MLRSTGFGTKRVHQRFRDMQKWALWHQNVHGAQGPLQAFTALFQYGLFDRFPTVKVVVLESGVWQVVIGVPSAVGRLVG